MIPITKDEKTEINKLYPTAHIVRTTKQKSKRHHYYCEETECVMSLIKQLREERGIISDS